MRHTRIRPAVLLVLLLAGFGRSDDKPKTPAPAKDWEAKLAGRSSEEVLAVLDQLAQEWTARKGGYEVAQHRFTVQAAELNKARQRLDDLKAPDAKVPLVTRAADVDAAIKVAQQLADYQTARVQQLEAVAKAGATLKKFHDEFEPPAKAAQDHLAAARAAVKAAKGVPADKLPSALAPAALGAEEERLKKAVADVQGTFLPLVLQQPVWETSLTVAKGEAAAAIAQLNELKARREPTVAALDFAEKAKGMSAQQLADEFHRFRALLAQKTAAIKGDADDYAKAAPHVAEARAKREAVKEPSVPAAVPAAVPNGPKPLLEAERKLLAAQQYLAARVRTADERAEKTTALVAALDEQEKKTVAYATTLDDARRTAGQLAAVAAEIERRVGRGDLDPAKAPEGVAEASAATGSAAKLDATAAEVQDTLAKLKAEREALRKPDPEAENLKSLTAVVLAHATARIDLLTDLKRLAAEYATARKDRPESEQKRLDQRAVERMNRDAARWDIALALDHSKPAADAADLLSAYYKELIDLDEKDDNLKRQKELLEQAVERTRKESADITKLRAVLEERGQKGEFDGWLAMRQQPWELKAEAGVYHDEIVRLAAVGGANARRVQALTGTAPPEPGKPDPEQTKQPANGGEIGKARGELFDARVRGLTITGAKIGLVLLAALIVPWFVMSVLRRSMRGGTDQSGNLSPVLGALRGVLKAGVWLAAIALVLSILGYDVMALVVGLAIGLLVIGLAARPMIADVLGSVVIFAERRFQVGDVVRLGVDEPARVVGLTWRSTALKNPSGQTVSVPNRRVTELTVENLSRGTEVYDTLAVTVSTDKDAGRVIGVIRGALAQCKNLTADQGVTVLRFTQKGHVKVVEYRFWWFLKDYEQRNKTRDEVFARIAVGLANEDMTGIEITLA